jgi:hypothetical protein
VSEERRGNGTVIYKLRFRLEGLQRVRYLGTDRARAENVLQALAALQRVRDLSQRIRAACRESAKALRRGKRRLSPILEQAGYKFHGLAIRRTRHVPEGENR